MGVPIMRKLLGQSNEQMVYKALKDAGEIKTIPEIASLIPDITERTVRRCVIDLEKQGFVKALGKRKQAVLYGLADKSMYEDSNEGDFDLIPLIPFAGSLMTVPDFLEVMVSPDRNPLNANAKLDLLRTRISNPIRRAMAGVILTSGETGQEAFIKSSAESLLAVEAELEYVLRIIKGFNASGVWFDTYRDRIAFQVRRTQQENSTLVQLAFDFVRSE